MKDLNYNYVVFNSIESKYKYNPNGYYTICMKDLQSEEQIDCVNIPLDRMPLFFRVLYNIHHSVKINRLIRLPFKSIWYPIYHKVKFNNNKPICFVILERVPISYLEYLKNRYLGSKFVALYRDLRKMTKDIYPDHPDNPIFDFQMTIDKFEARKYGYYHFDEFESKIDVPVSENYPLHDVFFAGKGKDRLARLLEAYDIFTKAGLNVYYYLTHVAEEDRISLPGVTYADGFMPYSEMLYHTVNSKCVLEINQYQAVGYTSRFLEAIMFNKRLITDNIAVTESKFYSPDNILYISKMSDINPSFVRNEKLVDYHYNEEFSPKHVIEKIDNILSK